MPRYNFLDEAGLKKYHQLAGYSEIPLEYTMYKKLDTSNGKVVDDPSSSRYCVTDYIKLPTALPYCLKISGGSRTICFYDENNNFLSGKTLSSSEYKLILMNEVLKAVKFRVSFAYAAGLHQVSIRALHDNTTNWLYDKINTDITETNNTIVRLHATYNIGVTPTTIEKGVSNKITISNVYFRFDGNKIYPSGGYEITRSGAAGSTTLFDGSSGGILNTGGSINDTISKSATYTLSMSHLGGTFTKAVPVSAYYPIIYGSTPDPSISEEYLERIWGAIGIDFYKSGKSDPSGTYTFTTQKDDYMYILVPRDEESDGRYNMTISEVKSSGFEVPMNYLGLVEMNNHTNRKYNVYRSQIQVNAGQKTLVVTGSCTTIS